MLSFDVNYDVEIVPNLYRVSYCQINIPSGISNRNLNRVQVFTI